MLKNRVKEKLIFSIKNSVGYSKNNKPRIPLEISKKKAHLWPSNNEVKPKIVVEISIPKLSCVFSLRTPKLVSKT
jgi:hypothetical protein